MDLAKGNLVLRPEQQADEGFLRRLFHDIHAHQFLPLGLPADTLLSLVEMQWRAQLAGYAHQFPARESTVVLLDGEPIGRLLIERRPQAIHLIDIAVISPARGHGIGTWLLQHLCRQADTAQQTIDLLVRPGNPALKLYQRQNFFVTETTHADLRMERLPN